MAAAAACEVFIFYLDTRVLRAKLGLSLYY